jgi:hypothetical protein|tara:strand:- start:148 stop:354 length:207 start_codon:yes stop_codon:yes gene_type:complete
MEESQQVFYITIASMGVAMILACMKYGYKSKCSEVSLGCITIKRDVVIENKYDVTHPIEEDEGKENNV